MIKAQYILHLEILVQSKAKPLLTAVGVVLFYTLLYRCDSFKIYF